MTPHAIPAAPPVAAPAARRTLVVVGRRTVAEGVVELALARPDGSRLPDWAPGAHIDVVLPDGRTRQYSLCGDRWDAATYRIAVQRELDGRGGSAFLHDHAAEGFALGFGGPRNNFRLAPAADHLFIAGGIGITPLLPMIRQAELLDLPWRLLYLGRSRARLAYLDELASHGERVTVHCADEIGRADLEAWRPTDSRVRVYACGPTRLLDAVQAWPAPPGGFPAKVERFTAASTDGSHVARAFEVVAARSRSTVTVAPDETVVAALARAGVDVITSCAQGVCGTCETEVLDGRPDHRDSLLDDAERAASLCMFPCVSRSLGPRLVLDV
ncbi:PDR/VanB family oxidoreductase [Micromonospora sp. DT81.3]|uniref:PDR/VanB family oxidoreductase n=1 Tax=Micromonospora sp. DT81.3 TaxID=3416523 RepID=UPI003CFAC2EB